MTNLSSTAALVADLEKLSKTIGQLATDLKNAPSEEPASDVQSQPEEKTVEAVKEPEVKKTESKVTFEQLKSLFAEKSQAGHTAELKEILNKLGAAKISAVKPEDYESAYLAAQEIK